MKKIDMINEMIDNGFINIDTYCRPYKTNKIQHAIHYLQYHVLKADIEKMYTKYLTQRAMCVTM